MSTVPNYRVYCNIQKTYVYTYSVGVPTVCPVDGGTIDPARVFTWVNKEDQDDATGPPSTSNDISQGYSPGSKWVDTSNNLTYTCVDNAAGAAIWELETVSATIGNTGPPGPPGGPPGPTGPGVVGDLPSIQIRRTTTFAITGAFTDVTFNVTDIENDPTVLEHNNTLTDRIEIKETGEYLINYHMVFDYTTISTLTTRVTLNDGGVAIPSSQSGAGTSGDTNTHNVSNSFVANLSSGDFITFQVTAGGGTMLAQAGFGAVLLIGAKGPTGDLGNAGPPGPTGNDGADGVDGAAGPPGGPVGPTGSPGVDGVDGVDGVTGNQGPIGATGEIITRKFDAYYDQSPDIIIPDSIIWTDIPLDTIRIIDSDYTFSGGATGVEINSTGDYLVLARVSTQITAGATNSSGRGKSQMRVLLNGSPINGSLGTMYNRQNAIGDNTASVHLILSLIPNDIISMQVIKFNGTGSTMRLLSEGCGLTIINV